MSHGECHCVGDSLTVIDDIGITLLGVLNTVSLITHYQRYVNDFIGQLVDRMLKNGVEDAQLVWRRKVHVKRELESCKSTTSELRLKESP